MSSDSDGSVGLGFYATIVGVVLVIGLAISVPIVVTSSTLIVNLLTEDNLPSYHRLIHGMFGAGDGACQVKMPTRPQLAGGQVVVLVGFEQGQLFVNVLERTIDQSRAHSATEVRTPSGAGPEIIRTSD